MSERMLPTFLPSLAPPAPSLARGAPVEHVGPARPAAHSLPEAAFAPPVRIQAALTIGPADDPYEREADAVADRIMKMPDPEGSRVQRACADCEQDDEDDSLRMSRLPPATGTPAGPGLVADGAVAAQVRAARQGGQALTAAQRAFFEPRLGHDFSAVRLHCGDAAARAARSVGARAFTVGADIVLGERQPGADTEGGRHLLAHELTHVVQQGRAPARRPGEEV